MKTYVLAGPAAAGNSFGYYKEALIPEGKFAVVYDGEYTNGGRGPIAENTQLYSTREEAEKQVSHFQRSCAV